MKHTDVERFYTAFGRLKHLIDSIPLTSYDRSEVLEQMVEMKMSYDKATNKQPEKNHEVSP